MEPTGGAIAAGRVLEFAAPRRQAARQGRIDSYIILRGIWYQLEAKVAAKQLDTPTLDYHGHHALALCYIVPELAWSPKEEIPPDSSLLVELADALYPFAVRAVYEPPKGIRPWLIKPKRRYYPGRPVVGKKHW
jgi:hypothetical protein